jgi:hypothetical protein
MAAGANESGVIDALTDAGRLAAEGKLTAALAIYDRLIESTRHWRKRISTAPSCCSDKGASTMRANGSRRIYASSAVDRSTACPRPPRVSALSLSRSQSWFQSAVDVAPDSVGAICNLEIAQSRQMHPARALPALQQARRLAPHSECPGTSCAARSTCSVALTRRIRTFSDTSKPRCLRRVACTGLATARRVASDQLEQRYLRWH